MIKLQKFAIYPGCDIFPLVAGIMASFWGLEVSFLRFAVALIVLMLTIAFFYIRR